MVLGKLDIHSPPHHLDPSIIPDIKIYSNLTKDLNIKCKTTRLLGNSQILTEKKRKEKTPQKNSMRKTGKGHEQIFHQTGYK